ncbi:MAG: type II toxin-antitoxin system prevent-host-death family antitoxin [Gemmatimonas sp.]
MDNHTVNIHYAKTHLSRLIEQVAAGESVVIANAGRPVARLVAYQADSRPVAAPGSLVGRGFTIGPDFDEPLDHLYADFIDLGAVEALRVAEPAPMRGMGAEESGTRSGAAPADPSAQADGA